MNIKFQNINKQDNNNKHKQHKQRLVTDCWVNQNKHYQILLKHVSQQQQQPPPPPMLTMIMIMPPMSLLMILLYVMNV